MPIPIANIENSTVVKRFLTSNGRSESHKTIYKCNWLSEVEGAQGPHPQEAKWLKSTDAGVRILTNLVSPWKLLGPFQDSGYPQMSALVKGLHGVSLDLRQHLWTEELEVPWWDILLKARTRLFMFSERWEHVTRPGIQWRGRRE